MNYDPMYWFWEAEIPDIVCEAIIQEGLLLNQEEGKVGEKEIVNSEYRKSRVAFFDRPENNWVLGICNYYCTLANVNAGWGFNVTGQQAPQFTQYGLNEYYEFHEDGSKLEEDMRKLSLVISITNPNQYKGGEFEFPTGPVKEISKRGSVLVFPSDTTHRVTPVTYGKRFSLVNWFTGPKFI